MLKGKLFPSEKMAAYYILNGMAMDFQQLQEKRPLGTKFGDQLYYVQIIEYKRGDVTHSYARTVEIRMDVGQPCTFPRITS